MVTIKFNERTRMNFYVTEVDDLAKLRNKTKKYINPFADCKLQWKRNENEKIKYELRPTLANITPQIHN